MTSQEVSTTPTFGCVHVSSNTTKSLTGLWQKSDKRLVVAKTFEQDQALLWRSRCLLQQFSMPFVRGADQNPIVRPEFVHSCIRILLKHGGMGLHWSLLFLSVARI